MMVLCCKRNPGPEVDERDDDDGEMHRSGG